MRANGGPLTVTLVWTDFPALASGGRCSLHRGSSCGLSTANARAYPPLPCPPCSSPFAAQKALVHDLDLTVRAAGLNGIPLLGNGGSVDDPSTPDRWGWCCNVCKASQEMHS